MPETTALPMSQLEELHAAYVGHRVMAAMMSVRATMARNAMNGSAARRTADEEEPSVEVVVWGDTDEDPGGGGTDVLQLDPWMFEAHITITVPPSLSWPPPPPGGTDDPPKECQVGLAALDAEKSNLAAEQTALKVLQDFLAQADSHEEKASIRSQIRQVKDSISDIQKQISTDEATLKTQGCL